MKNIHEAFYFFIFTIFNKIFYCFKFFFFILFIFLLLYSFRRFLIFYFIIISMKIFIRKY